MTAYTIVIADDHAMVRHGIRKIIEERMDFKVVGEASHGLELMQALKKLRPDLVILDISMPYLRGLEASREIKRLYPHIQILILTMHKNEAYLKQTLATGCNGYLLKEDASDELMEALETIRRGRTFVSGLLASEAAIKGRKPAEARMGISRANALTLRERQILKLVAEGKSSKEIAELLYVSVRTVEHHRFNLKRKLNLDGAMNLLNYAIREGYVTIEPNVARSQFLPSRPGQSPMPDHPNGREDGGAQWTAGEMASV